MGVERMMGLGGRIRSLVEIGVGVREEDEGVEGIGGGAVGRGIGRGDRVRREGRVLGWGRRRGGEGRGGVGWVGMEGRERGL